MERYILNLDASTSIGARDKNQDVFLADGFVSTPDIAGTQNYQTEIETDGQLHVFAVCDGVGQYPYSGPAAQVALQEIKEKRNLFKAETEDCKDSIKKWSENALISAQEAMLKYCKENNVRGSCTIVIIAIANNNFVMVNTGDSPAFLFTNNELTELSTRHNMANRKKMLGLVPTPEEENILLHHLGEDVLTFNEKSGELNESGCFLICSDGIPKAFDENAFKKHLEENKKTEFFVSSASEIPEADNCTLITIQYKKCD